MLKKQEYALSKELKEFELQNNRCFKPIKLKPGLVLKSPDIVYIFYHVPKTGGTTIKAQLRKNLKAGELLLHYPKFNRTGKEMSHLGVRRDEEISSLGCIDKVRVVYGHGISLDTDNYFNKKARRMLFLRNPVDRTISWYNHMREGYDKQRAYPKIMLDSGRILPFEEAFSRGSVFHNFYIKTLIERFSNERINSETVVTGWDLEKAKEILKRFFFIGITENPEDFMLVYNLLGIGANDKIKKVSDRFFVPKSYKETKAMILSKCKFDQELYEYALELNKNFKRTNTIGSE